MRRLLSIVSTAVLMGVLVPATSHAQQSLNLYIGGLVPNGYEARIDDFGYSNDVLVNNYDFLLYDIEEFHGVTGGAEYLVGLGQFFEGGLGVGIYHQTVPAIDNEFTHDNGTPVVADLKLGIVPFTATVRWLPFGRSAGIVPYIGGGVGILNWRYTEEGEFVDTSDPRNPVTFAAKYTGSGTAVGPVFLGGLRVPVGAFDVGGEVRYQKAEGDLPLDQDFSGSEIDLGGWTYMATFTIHF